MAGYIGTQAVSVNTTSATISDDLAVGDDLTVTDDAAIGGTLAVTGVVTANAGVVVDNFTLDGTTLALSSGNFTLDVAGDIIFDGDGGDILFKDGGTEWLGFSSGGTMTAAGAFILDVNGNISFDSNNGVIDFKGPSALNFGRIENSSSDFKIESRVQNKDIIFAGNDNNQGVNALVLDMGDAGAARFVNGTAALPAVSFISDPNTGMFRIGSDTLGFSTAGTQRLAIDSTGIKFHGDTATANALNDYEEGTWTPAITHGSSAATMTDAGTSGSYTKVGRMVTLMGNAKVGGVNGNGVVTMTGFPFTVADTVAGTGVEASGIVGFYGVFGAVVNSVILTASAASTTGEMYGNHNTSGMNTSAEALTQVELSANAQFRFSITYFST